MRLDERFWADHAHLSAGELYRRYPDWYANDANWRRAARKARERFPDLFGQTPQKATTRRVRPVEPRDGVEVPTTLEVIASDFHVPHHDRRAVGCLLGYVRDNPPDGFTINGDFADFYQVSRFNKDPQRELELQADIDECNSVLDAIDAVLPDGCKKRFVIGNHEMRMANFITANARSLFGLRCLTLESLLHLEERGYEVIQPVGRESSTFIGKVEVGHFDKATKHSAYTAKALVEERGCSVIQAHTHRLGAHYKRERGSGDQRGGWEIGCLCDLSPEYVSRPNWQQGFATITRVMSGRFHVALHEILGGELLAGGRRY